MPFHRTLLALAVVSTFAQAQVAPDAGRTLQQQQQAPVEPPRATKPLVIPVVPQSAPAPGGATVTLKAVQFHGATTLSDDALQAVVRDALGRTLDLAGLWGVAQRVSEAYRAAGYPFARAYLPPQELQGGTLRIEVVEGRYGRVRATGDAALAASAQAWLAPLVPGEVIASAPLERATLLLDDLPGVRAVPVVKPGEQAGTGDLDVELRRGPRVQGSASLDNLGNQYTGANRLQLDVRAGTVATLGDQVTAHAMGTSQHLWFGSLGYSLPLGAQGTRGHVDVSRTQYTLGGDFRSLDASGTAKTAGLGASHAFIRSQSTNLTVDVSLQRKLLRDTQGAAGTHDDKSSTAVPIALNFDLRGDGADAGLTYGVVSYTSGRLGLGANAAAVDAVTARTAGHFNKLNLDVSHLHPLASDTTLFVRVAGQWADKNVDSSEGFGLGGTSGVRAYPGGEGYGDAGWVGQVELRQRFGDWQPYVLADAGNSRINIHPWTAEANTRWLGGSGVGLRASVDRFSLDASVAWRVYGGKATSETRAHDPRLSLTASMAF